MHGHRTSRRSYSCSASDRFEEALAAFDAAQSRPVRPRDADVHNSRAGALRKLGRLDESAAAAREAAALTLIAPDFAEAALNLGTALLKLGRTEEALAAYRRASLARPNYPDAFNGAALALRALGRLHQARAAFEEALRLGCREAISGIGCLDLLMGDFERGWEGYEARWIAGKSLADALGTRFPAWAGPGRNGESVLVLNDHGLGDTIQFFRYLPMMARAGVAATFVCPAKLHRLLGQRSGVRLVEKPPDGEAFDAQIPISSLPRAFSTRLDTVPAAIPYLGAESPLGCSENGRSADRRSRLQDRRGVARQSQPGGRHRALDATVRCSRRWPCRRNVRLISLQKGYGVEQLDRLPSGMRVETLGDDFDAGPDAFVDAAAAIAHLDLVVTCDTSIAHLAGALGRPVWVALKNDAEWRWLRNREDSPVVPHDAACFD